MDKALAKKLLDLKLRIEPNFNTSNWSDVGLLTGHIDVIDNHSRLFRSMRFGDDDYGASVIDVLQTIATIDPPALAAIEDYLNQKFPLDAEYISSAPSERRITFAPQVFAIPTVPAQPDLVAVMMPFEASFNPVFEAIKSASAAASLQCVRADNVWNHATIIQEVFELIFKARIVVVDFSGKNANVMYETGIAHTLGRDVVPIVQNMDDIPFDMRHHRVLSYMKNGEGLASMRATLASRLATIAGTRVKADNPQRSLADFFTPPETEPRRKWQPRVPPPQAPTGEVEEEDIPF